MKHKITPDTLLQQGHDLRSLVDRVFSSQTTDPQFSPKTDHILTIIAALFEFQKQEASIFHPYFQMLPKNVSQTAFYWSPSEIMNCVVPYPDGSGDSSPRRLQASLQVFMSIIHTLVESYQPLSVIPDVYSRAEWLYIMFKTRGFGTRGFMPILDSANHDPTLSMAPLNVDGTHLSIATQAIPAGSEIFNTYGDLSPTEMAERYGYVDSNAAYVSVPSMTWDMIRSKIAQENETFAEKCAKSELKFFGNVTTRVETTYWWLHRVIDYKAFHPIPETYECVQVALQDDNDNYMAAYFAQTVQQDIHRYEAMAQEEHCQGESGNLAIIRHMNIVTIKLLRGILEKALDVMNGESKYR